MARLSTILLPLFGLIPAISYCAPFSDTFDGTQLDLSKWFVVRDAPYVADGALHLDGGSTRSEVQSVPLFSYGQFQMTISSSDWISTYTDSSFGLENFAAGNCHYGAILIGSGHLGLLRSVPDLSGNCTGDPLYQEYHQIPNWDAIRAAERIVVDLTWIPGEVTLQVSSTGGSSVVSSTGLAVPNVPMRFRLNADVNRNYDVDSVAAIPEPFTGSLAGLALAAGIWLARRRSA